VAHLSEDKLELARALVALYPEKRSALIPVLHLVQEQEGYLSPEGIEDAATLLGLTPADVRGTASFYDMFHLEPIGKYLVAVCTNIACMLCGAYELLEHIEESLGTHPGGTTPDGTFTLEEAECLALCGNAPCVTVNWRFFGDMTPEGWDTLADDLREGRLDGEVPAHGTLCRVRRSVGLLAGGGDEQAREQDNKRANERANERASNRASNGGAPLIDLGTSRTTPAAGSTVLPDGPGPADGPGRKSGS